MSKKNGQVLLLAGIGLLLLMLTLWSSQQVGFTLLRQDALNELFQYRNAIQNLLDRYRPVPEVLAATPLLKEGLVDPASRQDVNLYLEKMASATDASVIYLMDDQGTTIATSNWRSPVNFLNGNFSYRPYFQKAMAEGEGFYSALGATSGTRGFYYARRIEINNTAAGVVVVKRELDDIEQAWESPWNRGEAVFAVTDSASVVFISSRKSWLFHVMNPISIARMDEIKNRRRYDHQLLKAMINQHLSQPYSLVSTNSSLRRMGLKGHTPEVFLAQRVAIPETDWFLYLLIKTTSVNRLSLVSTSIAGGLLVLLVVGWLYWRERRRRFLQIKSAHDLLDEKVRMRTRALTASNHKLAEEIKHHKKTALSLRSTRNELVQAAKLAVLGQMSAGINHELNQPLAAIRSYTENGLEFLKRNRPETAADNMQEVLKLSDHMSGIIRQLKVFSRKASDLGEAVNLSEALSTAIKIVQPLTRKTDVAIRFTAVCDQSLVVCGDLVRLEQVFVNLISNGVQAVEGRSMPEVAITLNRDEQNAIIQIFDNGEGIPERALEQVFEPFFTTRSIDQGLGLGLSITRHIIESLDGRIIAGNTPEGGACFTVTLPLMHPSDTGES